jgi:AraC family transcriptional regulator
MLQAAAVTAVRDGRVAASRASAAPKGLAAVRLDTAPDDWPSADEIEAFDGWLLYFADAAPSGDAGPAPTLFVSARDTAIVGMPRNGSLLVTIPRAVLDRVADRMNAAPLERLAIASGQSVADATLARLADLVRAELAAANRVDSPVVEHLLHAMAAHVAIVHGGLVPNSRSPRGKLAAWQLRRAQDVLRSSLDTPVRVETVADACGLSVSHFSRAFRVSTGRAPGTWLREQRIEAAKSLLRSASISLTQVAAACGFADQSHLCRVFQRHVGVSPGVWRRCVIQPVQ